MRRPMSRTVRRLKRLQLRLPRRAKRLRPMPPKPPRKRTRLRMEKPRTLTETTVSVCPVLTKKQLLRRLRRMLHLQRRARSTTRLMSLLLETLQLSPLNRLKPKQPNATSILFPSTIISLIINLINLDQYYQTFSCTDKLNLS